MGPILAMSMKDIRLLLRDRAGMFFTVFFPVIFASVFGMVYSGMGGRTAEIRVVAVDRAGSPASQALIERLDAMDVLAVEVLDDGAQAADLVRAGRRSAVLTIPEGYGDWSATLLNGRAMELELGIDPSRIQERAMIQGLVSQAAFEGLSGSLSDPESMSAIAGQARARLREARGMALPERLAAEAMLGNLERLSESVRARRAGAEGGPSEGDGGAEGDDAREIVEPGSVELSLTITPNSSTARGDDDPTPGDGGFAPVRVGVREIAGHRRTDWHNSAFSVTFAQGVVWALIGCAAAFSMSLVIERSGGTLLRLRASPLSAAHVIAGKGVACVATTLVACSLLVVLGMLAFGLRIGQPAMLVVALLASSWAFVGIMMVLSAVGRTPRSAGPIGYAVLLTMAIVGGGMMPHFMMPAWMQRVGMISPVKWTVVSVENAVFRGATWGQAALPLVVLAGIGLVGALVGAWLFSRSRE